MKKFEYKRIDTMSGISAQRNLDEMGEDGWELVGIDRQEVSYGTKVFYIFKREKIQHAKEV